MDIIKFASHSWLNFKPSRLEQAQAARQIFQNYISRMRSMDESEFAARCADGIVDHPKLFGTSGCRGEYTPAAESSFIEMFTKNNQITPKMIYYIARSVAILLKEKKYTRDVILVMDPRRSSLPLALNAMQGLREGGIDVAFGGILPTSTYTLFNRSMVIVITASHNPVSNNGIKLFWDGRPLIRRMERRIEQLLYVCDVIDQEGRYLAPVKNQGNITMKGVELERRYFEYLNHMMVTVRLRLEWAGKLESRFLPIDLAYGSAACPMNEAGHISRLSPPLALFLSLGIPVIGYGAFQNDESINYRVGAAYAYGETDQQPRTGELAKFTQGLPGYGPPAPRIAFLPRGFGASNEILREKLNCLPAQGPASQLPVGFPEFKDDIAVVELDHPEIDSELATAVESEIMRRHALPGLMVDGDADRILISAPEISKQEQPFLSGDAMVRMFAELYPAEQYREIVFTVESGIALETALQQIADRHEEDGKTPFKIRSVTVGDRAIIDYFLDRQSESAFGGEPSGHIIFAEKNNDELHIIDDPFITYMRLIELLAPERFDLDRIHNRLYWEIPDVFCARKPDAWGGNGISLQEKQFLELWDFQKRYSLSQYAKDFIPAYLDMYAGIYSRAFLKNSEAEVNFSWEWERLLDGDLETHDWDGDMAIATIFYNSTKLQEELGVGLHLDRREWAGPDVIRLTFALKLENNKSFKMGEGIFRNSGTSPKNAGYHKLWPLHPIRKTALSEDKIFTLLTELAEWRAEWTDNWINTNIRNKKN